MTNFHVSGKKGYIRAVQRSRPFKGAAGNASSTRGVHRHPARRKNFSHAHSIGTVITLSAYPLRIHARVYITPDEWDTGCRDRMHFNQFPACNDDIFANLNLTVRAKSHFAASRYPERYFPTIHRKNATLFLSRRNAPSPQIFQS